MMHALLLILRGFFFFFVKINSDFVVKLFVSKYYLSDAGYGNKNGVVSAYQSVQYHLKEFNNHPPKNAHELFNIRYSSL